jgi:hypothetical protein
MTDIQAIVETIGKHVLAHCMDGGPIDGVSNAWDGEPPKETVAHAQALFVRNALAYEHNEKAVFVGVSAARGLLAKEDLDAALMQDCFAVLMSEAMLAIPDSDPLYKQHALAKIIPSTVDFTRAARDAFCVKAASLCGKTFTQAWCACIMNSNLRKKVRTTLIMETTVDRDTRAAVNTFAADKVFEVVTGMDRDTCAAIIKMVEAREDIADSALHYSDHPDDFRRFKARCAQAKKAISVISPKAAAAAGGGAAEEG